VGTTCGAEGNPDAGETDEARGSTATWQRLPDFVSQELGSFCQVVSTEEPVAMRLRRTSRGGEDVAAWGRAGTVSEVPGWLSEGYLRSSQGGSHTAS